jgi:hypothetical protein
MPVALVGCTATAPAPEESQAAASLPACVQISRIRSYEQLDARNLIVFAPDRQHAYHVEVAGACRGLRPGFGLEVQGASGRLCGRADEFITTVPGLPARGSDFDDRCRVLSVRPLDASALQELLISFGLGERGEPAAGEVLQEMPRR